jgi:two-component system nitrogen regulation sensor histidine kinase GlnL
MNTASDSLWAALPMPAVRIDTHGRIMRANPAAEALMVMSERALEGHFLWDRLPMDQDISAALQRIANHGTAVTLADLRVRPTGQPGQNCRLQLAPMDGDILCLIDLHGDLGRMERDAQAQSAARSAAGMAAMLAHEIKNPLAGIVGAAQLLEMGLSPQDQELTGMIVEETRRIVKLLEQVEQFGNLRPPKRRAVNIHDVLDRARHSARLGHAAHMMITAEYDPSLPLAHADPDQLVQVFLNLLKNAAEASADRAGHIRLRTWYDAGLRRRDRNGVTVALPLQIEISDDGPGITPDLAAQVFQPFVSGRENGTGLGLALVSKVIGDHDAWIALDSRPGHTAFRIALPLAPPMAKKE